MVDIKGLPASPCFHFLLNSNPTTNALHPSVVCPTLRISPTLLNYFHKDSNNVCERETKKLSLDLTSAPSYRPLSSKPPLECVHAHLSITSSSLFHSLHLAPTSATALTLLSASSPRAAMLPNPMGTESSFY